MENLEILHRLFDQQNTFTQKIIRERGLDFSQEEWLLRILEAMTEEISEVRNELNWKWWKNKKEVNKDALDFEIADLWIFLFQLTQMANLTPERLVAIIDEKTRENHDRQDGKSSKPGYALNKPKRSATMATQSSVLPSGKSVIRNADEEIRRNAMHIAVETPFSGELQKYNKK